MAETTEIIILSGKGGTGKTSLTAAFAHLAERHILCDLDVDAPDLHLLLDPKKIHTETFISGHKAEIREADCEACGKCAEVCRFHAVIEGDPHPRIDPIRCEGCKVCVALCPANAIDFPESECGEWYLSETRFAPMVHAQLHPGEENSGRLVALLRGRAKALAEEKGIDLILSDGPPGIGCPVISSLSGASMAVMVTEPTPSGIHDLERVAELTRHFQVPAGVIINKHDLNLDHSDRIAAFCRREGLPLLGRVPLDPDVTHAMIEGKAVTEFTRGSISGILRRVWSTVEQTVKMSRAA